VIELEPKLKTIAQALIMAQAQLIAENSESRREAEYLLSHVLNWSITKIISYPEYLLTEAEMLNFTDSLERRKQGQPLAYIKKNKFFWNVELEVSPAVLIPRPETELLVETILNLKKTNLNILDLGTGSGAIAISLAVNQPNWQLIATDKSAQALEVAKRNAKKYKLSNIEFYQGSWYKALENIDNLKNFDLIVSNPPYISADSHYLLEGDVRFEPISALVAADKGLADLAHIILNAKKYLRESGALFVEHGYDQAQAVQSLFVQAGFINIKTLKDLQGHDRVTFGNCTSELKRRFAKSHLLLM
jgi:release factor glutamine methyltransferase